jgi:hypothetical protein
MVKREINILFYVQAAGVFALLMVNCGSMLKLFFCPPLCSPPFMTLRHGVPFNFFERSN